MKAAVVSKFGDDDPDVTMSEEPKPKLEPGEGQILVRTLTCSLAFGDAHLLSGRLSLVFKPPAFPYIPGKDICGVVDEIDTTSTKCRFKVGDIVAGTRNMEAYGGMAEYVIINENCACLKPKNVDNLTAAACVDSSVTAMIACNKARIKAGERVLILGGSGGVGSAVVQLAKICEPSSLCATSSQTETVKSLGATCVINYKTENWWELEEYKRTPFDVIIDCVGGSNHYEKSWKVLKSRIKGGRFVAVVGNTPLPVAKKWYQLLYFIGSMLWRPFWTTFWPFVPNYIMFTSDSNAVTISKVLEMIDTKKLKILFDPSSPFPFTADGVRNALKLQASYHAHGKIVVNIANE